MASRDGQCEKSCPREGAKLRGMSGEAIRQIRWGSCGPEEPAGGRLMSGLGEIIPREHRMINCMKLYGFS